MYIDHNISDEYPFKDGVFYKISVDDSKPLEEQVDEEIEIYVSNFDISDGTNLNTNTFTLFIPFFKDVDTLVIKEGDLFKGNTYGMIQRGRIIGIYPSQLDGCTILLTRL